MFFEAVDGYPELGFVKISSNPFFTASPALVVIGTQGQDLSTAYSLPSASFSNFSQSSSNSKHFTSSFILSCYISGLLITHSKLSSMSVPVYFKTSGESYPVGIINFSLSRSCGYNLNSAPELQWQT